ncbi:MAG TPA: class I SAM-dependent methyltransferase [Gaiellaceae bacterium]|nr:class I SAM-dependent methyltransferase [Gaiellaceae bacterium]
MLRRLAEETRASLRSPEMLTGAIEGRLLEFLVYALRPQRVLELGTYSGYSSVSMASVLPPGGRIDTCELDPAHAEVARRYIEEAGYADRVTVHVGPALETIARLEGEFDLVFVDADKPGYPAYYDALVPRLSERGLLVLDNTLWSGRVVDPDDSPETTAIASLNDRIAADPAVVAVVLTVRDGVTLVRRVSR